MFFKKLILLRYNLHTVQCTHFVHFYAIVILLKLHVTTTTFKIQNISVIPQSCLLFLPSQSPVLSSHPDSKQPLIYFVLESFIWMESYMYIHFSVCLLWLTLKVLRFIHYSVCQQFLLFIKLHSMVSMHSSCVHLPVGNTCE